MFTSIEEKPSGDDSHDYIYLRNLHLSAVIGTDAWDRAGKPQPVILSLRLQREISQAAASDNIDDTVSYGQICKDVTSFLTMRDEYADIYDFTEDMYVLALRKKWGGTLLQMRTVLPKGSLRAEGGIGLEAAVEMIGEKWSFVEGSEKFLVNELKIACIIGVNAHERWTKQIVAVNLQITEDRSRTSHVPGNHREHWRGLINDVIHVSPLHITHHTLNTPLQTNYLFPQTVEISSYQTLEALASDIATVSCSRWAVSPITVSVEKPSALAFVDGAGVQITRRFSNGSVI